MFFPRRTIRAVLTLAALAAAGCASAAVEERSGLVVNDLPSPVQAAFAQNHQTAVYDPSNTGRTRIGNITERTAGSGQRTYLIDYTTAAGEKHSVEYNAGGDEIDSK